MTVTTFVVNLDRTKLLLCYHEYQEQWLALTSWVAGDEPALNMAARQTAERVGVTARPVDTITHAEFADSLLLEAAEHETSPYTLEEQFDARWLTRDEILASTCIEPQAQVFAKQFLAGRI